MVATGRALVLATLGLAAAVALAALGQSGSAAAAPTPQAIEATNSCFWVGPYTTKRGPEFNSAFPDQGAVYWTARYSTPPGATLTIEGRFTHARYQSLNSYGSASKGAVDALNDQSTIPDPGSTNPFLPAADRTAKPRNYTITVSTEPPPANPADQAPNTLYAGVAGLTEQQLIYRIYVPDKGRNITGGVGMPKPVLTLADGTVLEGSETCALLGSANNVFQTSRLPLDTYLGLRDQPGKPATFPAWNPARWRAFYSTTYTIDCAYKGICDPNPPRTGGQYSNIDNQYVGTFLNRGFGPVFVLRGKLPTTPRTLHRNPRMGTGQLRYWSMCQNESMTTTAGAGCLYDEQVPLTEHRRYTIVTSKPEDRPDNARRACGVGFIPWPANGDGAGHPDDALLFIRNMLPSAGFHQAVQDTRVPGDEATVMGPYLPATEYTTTAAFEQRGC